MKIVIYKSFIQYRKLLATYNLKLTLKILCVVKFDCSSKLRKLNACIS